MIVNQKLKLLDRWQSKARCRYTKMAAFRAWAQLRPVLTAKERMDLTIAWTHIEENEAAELNELLLALRKTWGLNG